MVFSVGRLYTVHPEGVWVSLKEQGKLYVDPKLWIYEGVPPAYEWLKNRLECLIPGYGGHYPWFAFLEPFPKLHFLKKFGTPPLGFPLGNQDV